MRDGRNNLTKPMGFTRAAQALTGDLSPEATRQFTDLVTSVAGQYSYDDAVMLNVVNRRLKSAARRRQGWAIDVLALMAKKTQKTSV